MQDHGIDKTTANMMFGPPGGASTSKRGPPMTAKQFAKTQIPADVRAVLDDQFSKEYSKLKRQYLQYHEYFPMPMTKVKEDKLVPSKIKLGDLKIMVQDCISATNPKPLKAMAGGVMNGGASAIEFLGGIFGANLSSPYSFKETLKSDAATWDSIHKCVVKIMIKRGVPETGPELELVFLLASQAYKIHVANTQQGVGAQAASTESNVDMSGL